MKIIHALIWNYSETDNYRRRQRLFGENAATAWDCRPPSIYLTRILYTPRSELRRRRHWYRWSCKRIRIVLNNWPNTLCNVDKITISVQSLATTARHSFADWIHLLLLLLLSAWLLPPPGANYKLLCFIKAHPYAMLKCRYICRDQHVGYYEDTNNRQLQYLLFCPSITISSTQPATSRSR